MTKIQRVYLVMQYDDLDDTSNIMGIYADETAAECMVLDLIAAKTDRHILYGIEPWLVRQDGVS